MPASEHAFEIQQRHNNLVNYENEKSWRRVGQAFQILALVNWMIAVLLALFVSPNTWIAETSTPRANLWIAIFGGAAMAGTTLLAVKLMPFSKYTRITVTFVQMLWAALLIHLAGGRIESHFFVFASLVLVAGYRERSLVLIATATILLDLILRGILLPISLFGTPATSGFQLIEHILWVSAFGGLMMGTCKISQARFMRLTRRQAELEYANQNVDILIRRRNGQIDSLNALLDKEMNRRIKSDRDREKLSRRLLAASRQAGVAEVTSGVMHNVGNVVHSIKIATDTVFESLTDHRMSKLEGVIKLLNEIDVSQEGAGERLKKVETYLAKLNSHFEKERDSLLIDVRNLKSNTDHVREILHMHQAYSRLGGVTEECTLHELVDDALNINRSALERHEIKVVKKFDTEVAPLNTEKHQVLQILVNLINNAKKAMRGTTDKTLTISTGVENDWNFIRIQDTGCGINAEDLEQIFNNGFTTDPDGNGIGLHSSQILAEELHGELEAKSEGEGKGTTLTLTLPKSFHESNDTYEPTEDDLDAQLNRHTKLITMDLLKFQQKSNPPANQF